MWHQGLIMNDRSVEDRLSQYPYNPSDSQWYAVFDESPIGIVFCCKKGCILKTNNAFCNIVEYTESELYNKSYKDITHPDDVCYDSKMLEKCLHKEIPGYEMYKRYLTKTGKIVWVRLTVWSILDNDGNVINFCAHVQRILNGEKAQLEKKDDKLVYRPSITIKDLISDNIKSFIGICVVLVGSFTSMGVAYWSAISEVSIMKQQQQNQQELLFRLYDIISRQKDFIDEQRNSDSSPQ